LLCEVAGYQQELEYTVVHVDPEHPKRAQWVTCLVSMQFMEELGNFQLPGIVYRSLRHGPHIIMLKNEVMVAGEWQDLIMVSLCVEIAIDTFQLCSLSVLAHTITPPPPWALCLQR
jgi:hypothetical protein